MRIELLYARNHPVFFVYIVFFPFLHLLKREDRFVYYVMCGCLYEKIKFYINHLINTLVPPKVLAFADPPGWNIDHWDTKSDGCSTHIKMYKPVYWKLAPPFSHSFIHSFSHSFIHSFTHQTTQAKEKPEETYLEENSMKRMHFVQVIQTIQSKYSHTLIHVHRMLRGRNLDEIDNSRKCFMSFLHRSGSP